jgi:pseudouridine synthase
VEGRRSGHRIAQNETRGVIAGGWRFGGAVLFADFGFSILGNRELLLVRLQKILAQAGVASRRASEQIIAAGRVKVNGVVVKEMGVKVEPERDVVSVDEKEVGRKTRRYVALHKPQGYICSRAADEDRPRIGDLLPKEWTDLFSVGRLDFHSEGLLFLTNDGDFCLKLTHPRYRISKVYVAKIEGRVRPETVRKFTQGIVSAGEKLQAARARLISANNTSSTVELELTEGKNREVRRLFEAENLTVERLQRVRIGPVKLGELPVGKWRTLTATEIKSLLRIV